MRCFFYIIILDFFYYIGLILKTTLMKNKILLYISLALLCFWLLTKIVNLYDYPVLSAIYELTSLIAVLSTFVMPIVVLIFLLRSERFNKKNYIAPLAISIFTILVMIFVPFFYTVNQ